MLGVASEVLHPAQGCKILVYVHIKSMIIGGISKYIVDNRWLTSQSVLFTSIITICPYPNVSKCCCVVVYSLKCWDWLGGGSRCNSEKHLEAKLACAKSYCDTQYCYWGGGRVKGHLTFILFSILSIDSHILLILLKEWSWSWLLLKYFSKHSPVLRCLTSTIPSQSLIPG